MHRGNQQSSRRLCAAALIRHALFVAVGAVVLVPAGARATSPSFTLGPPSPTLAGIGAAPGDVLNPAVPPVPGPVPPPIVGIPAPAMGLLPGDVVTGLSYGLLPPAAAPGMGVFFSVDGPSAGAPFAPPPANVACEAAAAQALGDVFNAQPFGPPLPLPNVLALDGNGLADAACGPAPPPGLGLIEPSPDDVTALEMCPASFVYSGVALTAPIYIALAPGSPTLVALGAGSGDILVVPPPAGPPAILAPAAALGLVPGPPGCGAPVCDQINDFDFGPAAVLFSLAPGSPSLGICGVTPGDLLLAPAGPCPAVAVPAPGLGLLPGDNIDALAVNFETDADFVVDPCDNCPLVANNDQLDGDADGVGDACDICVGSPNVDTDGDGVCDSSDPCTGFPNVDTDGDGVCDSGDPCPTDPTNTCCPPTPSACTGGFVKGTLIKKESAGQEKLIAKMLKGPLINQIDFGDPTVGGGTKYNLCIYDDASVLVGSIEVDRAGDANCSGGATICWNPIGAAPPAGKGYKFKDTDLTSDGTSKLLLKGGPTSAGKSKILWKGSGAAIPAGVTALLTSTANVTVQLHGDDAPGAGCWSITLGTVKKQTADFFKAK